MNKIDTIKKQLLIKKPKEKPPTDADFLSTGSTMLDLAISGVPGKGFRKGLYYYFVGDTSSGKTWFTLTCLAEAMNNPTFSNYRIIYDNGENGALMEIARFFGKRVAERMEPPRMKDGKPECSTTIEDFYFNLDDACKEGEPFIYIMDSMDVLSSEDETKKFEQHKKFARKDKQKQDEAIEKGKEPKGSYGDGKAKKNSANIRRVLDHLRDTGSILIIISQTRDNIGAGFWESDKTRSGGKALSFYASIEIWTSVRRELSKTVNDKKRQIGIVSTCHVKKNRVNGKHRRVDVNFYHSHGIDDIGTIVDWLVEEGRWDASKKKGTPIEERTTITAKEFNFKGRKDRLIRKIEEEGLEAKLKELAGKVWDEIESECTVERKPRYV